MMGFISDLKAIADVQRIKNGGTARLSVSQITCLIVNMSDARMILPTDQFNEVYSLFKRLRKVKKKKRMDIVGYYDVASKVVARFNMIAPFSMYSGDDPRNAELLLEVIAEKLDGIDALALETDLFGFPPRPKGKAVLVSVVLFVLLVLSASIAAVSLVELERAQEKTVAANKKYEEALALFRSESRENKDLKEEAEFWERFCVVVSEGGKKYHTYGCTYISGSKYKIYEVKQAYEKGYDPCLHCNPPKSYQSNYMSGNFTLITPW